MNINIINQNLIISDVANKRAQLMLQHSGLIKSGEKFKLDNFSDMGKLIYIVNYCKKNNLSIEYNDECKNQLSNFRDKENEFDQNRLRLQQYKEGEYDKKEFATFVADVKNIVPYRTLRDHQIKAAFHLYKSKNGANFSVPGAGKTSVVLAVYAILKSQGLVDTLFVIGPTTCFFAWIDEFEEVIGRKPNSVILAGGNKNSRTSNYHNFTPNRCELYITSFQTLSNDIEDVKFFLSSSQINAFVVIDEAHYIKRLNGQWSSTALELSQIPSYKCILTGTPMPRSFTDLYNLFEFLWPDNNPISAETERMLSIYDENQHAELISQRLEQDIGPLHYRVRKSELGLADQIMHPTIQIPMGDAQKKIYETIQNRIIDFNKEDGLIEELTVVDHFRRRARLIRLRQVASYPKLLDSMAVRDQLFSSGRFSDDFSFQDTEIGNLISSYDELETPTKAIELLKLIKELASQNKKVIIWSSFVGTIKYLSKFLTKNGFTNKYVIGEIPFLEQKYKYVESREEIRKEFVDLNSGLDVIIANPAAFAESVSLHKGCQHAIYYDLSYNCAQFLQSLDRIHRVGGSEDIESHYYFLENLDTIEHDIYDNLLQKRDKMYNLIEQDYSIYSLDMEESYEADEEAAYKRLFNS